MECKVQSKTLAEPERKSAHMDAESVILKVAVYAAAVVMILIPLILIGYILIRGLPNLRWSLFAWEYNRKS